MSKGNVMALLEGELGGFAARAAAEDLYRHMLAVAAGVIAGQRPEVVGALRNWLGLRAEPRTMLAAHIIQELGLVELRRDLEYLRDDIVAGRAFLPYYVRWVDEAIKKLQPP